MKIAHDRIVVALSRAWCVAAVASVIALAGIARASDPVCQATHAEPTCEIPLLGKIPYLNRLFITVNGGDDHHEFGLPVPGATKVFRRIRVEGHIAADRKA